MRQDPLSISASAIDSNLNELVGRYLDDAMSEADARAFEQRLIEDPRASEALGEILAQRGLVDTSFEKRDAPAASECDDCRALFHAYAHGTLRSAPVGRLSKHLEECPECAEYYQSSSEKENSSSVDGKASRLPMVLAAAALMVAGGLLALPLYRVLGINTGSNTAKTAEVSAPDLTWPLLPFPPENISELADIFRLRRPDSDSDAVNNAIAQVNRRDPGFLEAAARSKPVAAMLESAGSAGFTGRERDRATFLIVFLNDSRLAPIDRKELLQPLCGSIEQPGPLLWTLAETTDSAVILQECLKELRVLASPAESPGALRGLFDRAVALGAPTAVKYALWSMADAGHPEVTKLCGHLLDGSFGSFAQGEFPEAAVPLFRCLSKARGREAALTELSDLAKGTLVSAGRLQVLKLLWLETKTESWNRAILAMAVDRDSRVRRGVVLHIRDAQLEVDRAIIESLAADSDREVRSIAAQLLLAPDRR